MLNFKLSEANVKIKWSACHERGTKKKSESPTGFEPLTPKTLGGHSIHLSYGELMVHIWQASRILLGSAMSMSDYVMKEMKDRKF